MYSDFMRRMAPVALPVLASVMALGFASAASAQNKTDPATLQSTGKAVNCLSMNNVQSTIQAGDKVIMFKTNNNQWYRNDLKNSCSLLGQDRILVFKNMSNGQYCSLDMFSVVDSASRTNYGGCSLGEFTPVNVPKDARF